MTRTIRIATRGSRLARWQTEYVASLLRRVDPALGIEIIEVTTIGDETRDRAPSAIGQTGVFTKELEQLLLAGKADIAVHSLKDLETILPAGLALLAMPTRADPRDTLICRQAGTLAELPPNSCIGTASIRRQAQLLALRGDLRFVNLRGNVPTRLDKLARGDDGIDAIVLAWAGLERLGLTDQPGEILAPARLMPAVGQGVLAIEGREDDAQLCDLVRRLDNPPVRAAATAERAWLRRLHGGCQVPAGALATVYRGQLHLSATICALDGQTVYRDHDSGPQTAAAAVGEQLAATQLARGADRTVAEVVERLRTQDEQ